MGKSKKQERSEILDALAERKRTLDDNTKDRLWNLGITKSEITDLFATQAIPKPKGASKMIRESLWNNLIKADPLQTAEKPAKETETEQPSTETEGPTSGTEGPSEEKTGDLEGAIRDLINVISVSSTEPLKVQDGAGVTETDISSFDALGYSVTNADSKTATDAITPSVEEQKVSNFRFSVEGLVTSNLWRDVDSTMNEDVVLRHKIEFGGDLYSGDLSGDFSEKPELGSSFNQKLRPVLYNRDFTIPKYQTSQPETLTIVLDQISPPQDNFFDNLRNNPEGAPWRQPNTNRTEPIRA